MASTYKKKTEKVKKFSLCFRSGNINPLMQAFGQTFEITVNTIFHYLPFTRARWRRRTAPAKIRGKKRLADGQERWGEEGGRGLSAQHVEGVGEGKPSPKTVDHQIPPLSKSLWFSYSTRHEKLGLILLRTL